MRAGKHRSPVRQLFSPSGPNHLFIATLLLIAARTPNKRGSVMPETSSAFVGLSADVVAAYVSNNSVPQTELPSSSPPSIARFEMPLMERRSPRRWCWSHLSRSRNRSRPATSSAWRTEGHINPSSVTSRRGGHPRAVPGEVVTAVRLPDGRAELFQGSVRVGQGVGAWADKEGQEGGEEARGLSADCAGERPGSCRAFFVAAWCDEAECLRSASAATMNPIRRRLLARDDKDALRQITQANWPKMLDGIGRCAPRRKNEPLSLQAGARPLDSCWNITASSHALQL